MCLASNWIKSVFVPERWIRKHAQKQQKALAILPAMFTKREDLPAKSLCCGVVSVDLYHAPLGNAGLCKCLQITIFLK